MTAGFSFFLATDGSDSGDTGIRVTRLDEDRRITFKLTAALAETIGFSALIGALSADLSRWKAEHLSASTTMIFAPETKTITAELPLALDVSMDEDGARELATYILGWFREREEPS